MKLQEDIRKVFLLLIDASSSRLSDVLNRTSVINQNVLYLLFQGILSFMANS
jgi:hypothetical protein